jgi:hypothetical protein
VKRRNFTPRLRRSVSSPVSKKPLVAMLGNDVVAGLGREQVDDLRVPRVLDQDATL